MRLITASILGLATLLASPEGRAAQARPEAEIEVTLFGQPCKLKGPPPKSMLEAVHGIGPEKIPSSPDLKQSKDALARLKAAKGIPSQLEDYREKFVLRLEQQAAFHETIAKSEKSGKSDEILALAEQNMNPRRYKDFRMTIKKIEAKGKFAVSKTTTYQELFEIYNDGIQANPEQSFHDITEKKLGIRYSCDWGDGEDESNTEEEAK